MSNSTSVGLPTINEMVTFINKELTEEESKNAWYNQGWLD